MKFDRIKIRCLGPFAGEIDLDLAGIEGTLVAITGANGAGKSTLLELLGGALFRECPTRGSLRGLATDRSAFVEVDVVNGARWTVRQTVDPIGAKSETLILDAGGRPVLEDGKVSTGDAWVRAHLPPAEVLYASMLGAQGSAGFLEMKPAARKAVLNRILGIEHLEERAAVARERGRVAREDLRVVEARLGDLGPSDVAAARAVVECVHREVSDAEQALLAARAAVEAWTARSRWNEAMVVLSKEDSRLRRRANELRDVLAAGDAIRAAVAETESLTVQRAGQTLIAQEHQAAADRIRAEVAVLRERWAAAKTARAEAEGRIVRAQGLLAQRSEVDAARAELESLGPQVETATRLRDEDEARLERLRRQRVAGLAERVVALRATLGELADWRQGCADYDADMGHEPRDADEEMVEAMEGLARDALDRDDGVVARAKELPEELRVAENAARHSAEVLGRILTRVTACERVVDRGAQLATAERDLAEAEAGQARAIEEGEQLHAQAAALVETAKGHERAAEEARRVCRTCDDRIAELSPLRSQARSLDDATALLAELEPELERVHAEIVALRQAAPPNAPATRNECVADLEGAERSLAGARAHLARAELALEAAQASSTKRADLEADRDRVAAELADWTVLAASLGKDGLQALLIDAAGPELTALCNDLLHTCVGSRWSVAIETTRLSSDGRRQIEGLEVRVVDTERGRDAPVETYSGGERVLIGEAVSLALTAMACRRSGLEGVTLVRDESGAALDPEKAHAYVAMLRRAATLVGASKVLLVSHSEAVQDLADARIVVADGRVEVQA